MPFINKINRNAKVRRGLSVIEKKVRKSALTAASHVEPCLHEEALKQKGYSKELIDLYIESYHEAAGSPETQRQRAQKRAAQQQARKKRLRKQNVDIQVTQSSSETDPILEIERLDDFQVEPSMEDRHLTLEVEFLEDIQLTPSSTEELLIQKVENIDDVFNTHITIASNTFEYDENWWDELFQDGLYFNVNANRETTERPEVESVVSQSTERQIWPR